MGNTKIQFEIINDKVLTIKANNKNIPYKYPYDLDFIINYLISEKFKNEFLEFGKVVYKLDGCIYYENVKVIDTKLKLTGSVSTQSADKIVNDIKNVFTMISNFYKKLAKTRQIITL